MDEEGLEQLDEQQLKKAYEAIINETKKKRFKRLVDSRKEILESCGDYLKASGLQIQAIEFACNRAVYGFFSYDTK